MPPGASYELVDFGGGARLERFAGRLVDRPHPGALEARADPDAWRAPDLRFDRERGWTGPAVQDGPWPFGDGGLRLELRTTDAGQVGLFPEQLGMLPWLRARVAERVAGRGIPSVLHLFAYTGLVTLAIAEEGADVTHVDASRPTVAWARRNADLSGLTNRSIRWIVDDAVGFAEREGRRGRRYAGIVLDPPTYGHGPAAQPWRLQADLPNLLAACDRIIEPDGFVLLTAHTPGFDADRLARLLDETLPSLRSGIEGGDLSVSSRDGRRLELGAFARTTGKA